MIPKTKIQLEVAKLSERIKDITEYQIEYAFNKVFDDYFYKTKQHVTCFTCGHKWADKTPKAALLSVLGGYTCPGCGRTLKCEKTNHRVFKEDNYIYKAEVIGDYQVLRYFYVNRKCKAGLKADQYIREVIQHWIRIDGKSIIRSVGFANLCYNLHWTSTKIEIRQTDNDRYYIHTKYVFPNSKIHPIIKRNGYANNFHRLHPAWFFKLILSEPKAETLLKAKQYSLFTSLGHIHDNINEYWASIRICIRNNYIVEDQSIWFDHLSLLRYFGKDILNHKFICPKDIDKDHQILIDKRDRIRMQENLEKRKLLIKKENKQYVKLKKKYFELHFSNGDIDIAVLKNVEDILKEGSILHHCVYSNQYYKKEDSLILSARRKRKRLETIEFSLSNMQIIQSRGLCNKPTEDHDKILELVKTNISIIKKLTA